MKFNQSPKSTTKTTEITDFTETDYISIINVLYGLECFDKLTFKDNNKYNLSKDNVILTE